MHPFEYMIVVDFEATCWEDDPKPLFHKTEIIEFPAVLLNLANGEIESVFHQYLAPVEYPILTEFCIGLTGITQNTVDKGITLQSALHKFHNWAVEEMQARNLYFPKTIKSKPQGNCALTTWTDWDFEQCLSNECKRKGLKKPSCFNQWMDARAIFRDWYHIRPAKFINALRYAGLHFRGRQHSGIDDAKNLARLVFRMSQEGAPFRITKDLTPSEGHGHGFSK